MNLRQVPAAAALVANVTAYGQPGPLESAPHQKEEKLAGPCSRPLKSSEHKRPVRVGDRPEGPPKKTKHVAVNFPETDVGHIGLPMLEAVIGADGTIEDVAFIRRPVFRPPWPEAEEAILEAIREWEYETTILNGEAVPVCMTVAVHILWQ